MYSKPVIITIENDQSPEQYIFIKLIKIQYLLNVWDCFKEITFIEQGCIKLIKVILFLMLQNSFISNKCCSFKLYIKES